jgi:hypothetical protein
MIPMLICQISYCLPMHLPLLVERIVHMLRDVFGVQGQSTRVTRMFLSAPLLSQLFQIRQSERGMKEDV